MGAQAGVCPPQIAAANLCLDISAPAILGAAQTNASGEASLTFPMPATPDGFYQAFQAVLVAGANSATSNTEVRYNANYSDSADTGLNGLLIGAYIGAGTPTGQNAYTGVEITSYYDGAYWNSTTLRDVCTLG